MYGLLKPANHLLSCEEKKVYSRVYCGQCAALNDNFGYLSRITTSYDAAFFGLLIAAQQDKPALIEKRWCAIAPIKKKVCSSIDPATKVSAALAVTFAGMKIKDKQQEKKSRFWTRVDGFLSPTMSKATDILSFHRISNMLVAETLNAQQCIEKARAGNILNYAAPTSRLLSQLMSATAVIAGCPENSEILTQIGHALGRVIYLVDACVDLSDDMAKKEFNALVATYGKDGKLQLETGARITGLIVQKLKEIRELLPKIELKHHKAIIENILITGLPLMIRQQLSASVKKISKTQPGLLKYAPHSALASALCLLTTQSAEAAGWQWGSKYAGLGDMVPYGCTVCETCGCGGCLGMIECCINPCVIFCPPKGSDAFSHPIALLFVSAAQSPKIILPMWPVIKIVREKLSDMRSKAVVHQKQREEERKRNQQEKVRQIEAKRQSDNAAYLNSATQELKKAEQAIKAKIVSLQLQFLVGMDYSFDGKIQRIISKESKANAAIIYSLSHEIAEGIKQITSEAQELDRKIQSVFDTQANLNQAISSVRQLQNTKDNRIENQLKLYEELTSSSVIMALISDQRFEDYHAIAEKILSELSLLGEKSK